jgi:NAD(P)-dependent dehydrogenase (short-subunit alcohol dehydrogenase family)
MRVMNATAIHPLPATRNDFAGKVAVVVGGGRESTATAAALASAGAAVALAAVDETAILRAARAIHSSGGRALAVPMDLGEPTAVARLMEATEATFGRLDVAVNSPGVTGSDCRAVYLAMRYELPVLVRSGGGVIVNSALSGAEDADCVIGLSRAAALDHADRDVRINAVAYGPGTPEDFAAATLWLCSERGAYVNGGVVPVGLRAAAA